MSREAYSTQDFCCYNCGKFILTEEYKNGRIDCIKGSYEDGYYVGAIDAFYCKECSKKLEAEIKAIEEE